MQLHINKYLRINNVYSIIYMKRQFFMYYFIFYFKLTIHLGTCILYRPDLSLLNVNYENKKSYLTHVLSTK